MKKNFLRMICLLAAVIMIFTAAACSDPGKGPVATGGGDETTARGSDEKLRPDIPEKLNEDGFTLSILNYAEGSGYSKATLDVEYDEELSRVDEAIYRRNRKIEDEYKCTISVEGVAVPSTTLTTLVGAGDSSFDLSMCYEEWIGNVLTSILGWDVLPNVDLTAPWWNVQGNRTFNIRGIQFAATGDFSLSHYNKIYCFIYNKDLYDDVDTGYNLYEQVRNRTWTIERLYEIAKPFNRNLDGDINEITDDDGHGIVATSKVLFSLLLNGSGTKIIQSDKNGDPYFALDGRNQMDILQRIVEINTGDGGYFRNAPNPNDALYLSTYAKGNTLFYACILSGIGSTPDYDFETGYMPAPLYDEQQENYHSVSIGGNVMVIPATIEKDRREDVSTLLEYMSYLSRDTVVKEYVQTYLKTRMADGNDAEMIQLMFDTVDYDLANNLFAKGARLAVNAKVFHPLVSGFSSILEGIKTDLESTIDSTLENIEKMVTNG
ncbi:MAG: hypothetical protein IJU75_02315 [Clostridia bacterium]|nr:hypothetical protein [Clostridia bacterium]